MAWNEMDIARAIVKDEKAVRRGVQNIEMHEKDWADMGDPLSLLVPCFGWLPVDPIGSKQGVVRWRYKRRRRNPS